LLITDNPLEGLSVNFLFILRNIEIPTLPKNNINFYPAEYQYLIEKLLRAGDRIMRIRLMVCENNNNIKFLLIPSRTPRFYV
jgi:hypothetical protein